MSGLPRISVVVPSYNQGRYLEDCLRSIIGQGYPDLEVLVYDGGSTDQSVEILRSYSAQLAFWRSEKDGGQASAINEGFRRSTGQILCWLNSDDMYMPGALAYVAERLRPGSPQLVFGDCLHFWEGTRDASGSDVAREHLNRRLTLVDYIIQPSAFWTREAWETTGELDAALNYAFDWEWWVRAQNRGVVFLPVSRYLSIYRAHAEHKSGTGGQKRLAEFASLYGRQAGSDFERLFTLCSLHSEQIASARSWIRRLRLSRFEPMLLRSRFPHILGRHRFRDVLDVLMMT